MVKQAAQAGRGWKIEHKGIDWVDDVERRRSPRHLFWPWTAANCSIFTVAYGAFVVAIGLNWWQSVVAVVVGIGLSYPVVGLVALAGTRGGAPTMTLSRAAFGLSGNKLPTFFVYLSLVGWETVSVALGALATRAILVRIDPDLGTTAMTAVGFAVTAALVIIIGVYGYDVIMRVQKWITLVVATMTVAYFVMVIPTLDFSSPLPGDSSPSGGFALVVGGISLVVASGIGWAPGGADYSRYVPRTGSAASVVRWTIAGGIAAPLALKLGGVLLVAGDPQLAIGAATDPIGAFAAPLPTWFLIPFLLSFLLSVIAGAVFNLYSSGFSLLALGVRLPRWAAVGVDGVLMILGGAYLVFIAPTFFGPLQAFLIVIGVVTAAWAAVFVADLFLHRRSGYLKEALYTPTGVYGRYNLAGMLSLTAAIVVGWGLVTSADPNIQRVLGYLLTPAAKHDLGASNIGVVVAFLVAGVLYTFLSTTILRPHGPHQPTTSQIGRARRQPITRIEAPAK